MNKSKYVNFGIILVGLTTGAAAQSATLTVCQSGCAYSQPSHALNAASSGDTIEVRGGEYYDCMTINKSNITVRGVNGRPVMYEKICSDKGIIVTASSDIVLDNLELRGASNGTNLAGVRHDALGKNVTLRNMYIHSNDDGILGSSSGDTVLIEDSVFENNGANHSSGPGHNIYISQTDNFIMRRSKSLRARLNGHEVKTRAYNNLIENSVVATLDGADARNFDFSNGGNVTLLNNVIEKGPNAPNRQMVGWAAEGGNSGTFIAKYNKVIDDRGSSTFAHFFKTNVSIDISENTFVSVEEISNNGGVGSNRNVGSRSDAGYGDFPNLPSVDGSSSSSPTPPPASSSSGAVVRLKNVKSQQCVDLYGGSTGDRATIGQWGCEVGNKNQEWNIRKNSNGSYQISSAKSNKCIDLFEGNNSNGAQLGQYGCGDGNVNQQFQLRQVSSGVYLIVTKSDKCIDIDPNRKTSTGAMTLQQWDCHGDTNQQLRFEIVSGSVP